MEIQVNVLNEAQLALNQISSEYGENKGGILAGNIEEKNSIIMVNVEGIILGEISQSFIEEIRFSSDLWKNIYQNKTRQYPNKQIVGWFLINRDHSKPVEEEILFHNRFFNDENHILLFINNDKDFCAYHEHETKFYPCTVLLNQNFSSTNLTTNSKLNLDKPAKTEGTIPLTIKKIMAFATIFFICILFLMYKDLTQPIEQTSLQNYTADNGDYLESDLEFESNPDSESNPNSESNPDSKSATLEAEHDKNDITLENELLASDSSDSSEKQSQIPTKKEPSEKEQTASEASTHNNNNNNNNNNAINKYVVKKGDSLWSISEKYYGTGFSFYKIMKQNEIINPNTINVGQILEIPK